MSAGGGGSGGGRPVVPAPDQLAKQRGVLQPSQTSVTTADGKRTIFRPDGSVVEQEVAAGFVEDRSEDKQIHRIGSYPLFISSGLGAHNIPALKQAGVTHILNMAARAVPAAAPDQFEYKLCKNILDIIGMDLLPLFPELLTFVDAGVKAGGCLVHCHMGVSRSASVCAAWLITRHGYTAPGALGLIKQTRSVANPHSGFRAQLEQLAEQHQQSGQKGKRRSSKSSKGRRNRSQS